MGRSYFIILALIVILIIRIVRRSPSRQGDLGEIKVSSILKRLPDDYYVINDVLIPNRNGTSQIDHVVISPYGIFVIETKNYKGWIFGSEKSEQWKETFRTTGGSYFRNPIKQNWGHIYALSEFLNIDKRVFKPIIVFSDKASLNIESSVPVVYMSQLRGVISEYQQQIISPKDVIVLYDRIIKANIIDPEAKKKHTESIKNNVAKEKEIIRSGRCPRCGGNLILRDGRYGQFYGCSNYPKCRYTKNI